MSKALLDSLFPRIRQGILASTLLRQDKAWYASELARRLGVPSSSLQRELKELTEVGILKSHQQGRMSYFQANVESPIFPELRGLILKTVGLIDVLRSVLLPLAEKLQVVFVYGSIASATEESSSDIDLMIVGSLTPVELALPLRSAREQVGREINPKIYTPEEFSRKWAQKDSFLARVIDRPKLFVLGDEHELDKIEH